MDVYQRRRLVALSAIAAIFIVFVLLIRSCGGDDTTTTPTPVAGASGVAGATSQTKAAYIDQADQICLETNNQIAGVDVTQPTADTDLGQLVSNELQSLQSLTPPEEDTNKLDNYLSALEKQAKAYKQKGVAVERGDTAAAAEIDTTLDAATADAADAGTAFGFAVCGDISKVSNNGGGNGDSTDSTTSDTGGTVTPTPTTTTPVTPTPTTPPTDTGTPPAPTDGGTGGTGSDSGGVSP
jgi:hypothetical protein